MAPLSSLFRLALWGLAFGLAAAPAFSQHILSGQITAREDGSPLPGATIRAEPPGGDKARGAVAAPDGTFRIENLAAGTWHVIVSFVGFQTVEQAVSVPLSAPLSVSLPTGSLFLEPSFVYALREYPITRTVLSAEEVGRQNLGQDFPILMNFQPSIVTTSDAGAGIGYTGMRIRGSDPTRTNVTLNGIPLNDSESQGVFWVNMPDFATSVEQVTIQRGVGTSVNGAGAFGASVNIGTVQPEKEASAQTDHSFGSFNTLRHNLQFHTGTIGKNFSLYGRLSKISSDGYIDRASADLKSFFVSARYEGRPGALTLNVFSGQEVTFQAWNGVPEDSVRAGNRRFNELARYDNETDNYQQDHYQLLYDKQLGRRWKLNAALHYTRGRGYFEQLAEGQRPSDYGLLMPELWERRPRFAEGGLIAGYDSLPITHTDLIRRRWLDNHFYGGIWSVNYQSSTRKGGSPRWDVVAGGGWNRYTNRHFGQVIWAQFMPQNPIRHVYYDNDALKTDLNLYGKASFQAIEDLFLFLDLQVRRVGYTFTGFDFTEQNELVSTEMTEVLTFFNPKAGISYRRGGHEWYATFGVGNREPNRADFVESTPASRPRHETLHNVEVGYLTSAEKWTFGLNGYWMNYLNQLVLTGQINDVGAYTRTNVANSFRAGIEAQVRWQVLPTLSWQANATLSRNRIREFTEFLDNFDSGEQVAIRHGQTDIALSPNLIAASQIAFQPTARTEVALLSKYVGRQFLDNTNQESRSLSAYATQDLRLSWEFALPSVRHVRFSLLVNNLFNRLYESNGYTFGFIAGGEQLRFNYLYPQAGTNFLAAVSLKI